MAYKRLSITEEKCYYLIKLYNLLNEDKITNKKLQELMGFKSKGYVSEIIRNIKEKGYEIRK